MGVKNKTTKEDIKRLIDGLEYLKEFLERYYNDSNA